MLARFNQLGLRIKLNFGFATLIGLLFLAIGTALLGQGRLLGAVDAFIQGSDEVDQLSVESLVAMGDARRYEKEFLLKRQSVSDEEARSRYATLISNRLDVVRENLAKIATLTDNAAILTQARVIEGITQKYESRFLQSVNLYGRLGRVDQGLEGKMREEAHFIEALLARGTPERLMVELLSLRRFEKDFIMRNSLKYVSAFEAMESRFRNDLERSALPRDSREALLQALGQYGAAFRQYIAVRQEIDEVTQDYLVAVHQLEPALAKIHAITEQEKDATNHTLAQLNKMTRLVLLVVGAVAILLGILVAGFIVRDVERSLDAVVGFSRRIAAGDRDARLPAVAGNNEFSVLTAALNTMATALQEARRHDEIHSAEVLEAEAQATRILESSADGLLGIDADGIITFMNPAGLAMLGYRADEVIGQALHALLHHSRADCTPYPFDECPSAKALQSGEQIRVNDEVYWHANGYPLPVMYAIHPTIEQGKITGAVISFVDVTVQRAAAQAREKALITAESLARVKSDFLSNMSHEIRTPLNGVLGFAKIGANNYQNSEKALNAFLKITDSGQRLLGVVNDILDFSKIEAGKLAIVPTAISLTDLIVQTVELVRMRAQAKRLNLLVELAPDLPETCSIDSLRLGQILLNLLNNAVKFTDSGSVTLRACRQGDQLVFSVSDTGIGMSDVLLSRLFTPFEQADGSSTRRYGGTGLGLAISKRIVELMGGSIGVGSEPGVGSTFEFNVPYVPAPSTSQRQMQRPLIERRGVDKPLAGLNIMVAEDDPTNQAIIEDFLLTAGAQVTLADNGADAVEKVGRHGAQTYDMVLMDVQMPVMDGHEATRRLGVMAPKLPVIGQTAHAYGEEVDKCFASGMVGHIAKPLDPAELIRIVLHHAATREEIVG